MSRIKFILFFATSLLFSFVATVHVRVHQEAVPNPLKLNQTSLETLTDPLEYRLFVKLNAIKNDMLVWQENKFRQDIEITSRDCYRRVHQAINNCYMEYSAENDIIVEMVRMQNSLAREQTFGCCAIWKYHKCIVRALRPYARFRSCTEMMVIEAEADIEDIVNKHMNDGRVCPDYYVEGQLCEGVWDSGIPFVAGLQVICFFGFLALIVCILLVGLSFYRFLNTPRYVLMPRKAGPGDMVELMER